MILSLLRVRLAIVACATLSLSCLGESRSSPKPDRPANYTESISGTLVKFDMVGIPAGEVVVADPANKGKTCRVRIKAFWMGKSEVTWDAYDVFVFRLDEPNWKPGDKDAVSHPSKPYGEADRGFGHKGYPVINESFLGADSYCKWLSVKTGHTYRLPTEAEWQYACLAGKPEPDGKHLADYAWFGQETTHPVAKKLPNAWGVYDMLGNVGEWCTDLTGKPVVCGGSYEDDASKVTSSARRCQTPMWQANDPQEPKSKWWLSDGTFVGFRVIRLN